MNKKNAHHLIGSLERGLPQDTCIYLDGIDANFDLKQVVSMSSDLFRSFGYDIQQVVIGNNSSSREITRTLSWLSARLRQQSLLADILSIQFFPTKRNTINETWRPEIYLAVTTGYKNNSIFFSIAEERSIEVCMRILEQLRSVVNFCAAYVYYFPNIFSSLAYYWGIVIEPADGTAGKYEDKEAERLGYWRDNTQIGILCGGHRKFYRVCDGYVRDVYPTMILGEAHLARKVGEKSLRQYLLDTSLASVRNYMNGLYVVSIDTGALGSIQRVFDEMNISLSGSRLCV